MRNFKFHPEVIDPADFTPKWFGERCAELLETQGEVLRQAAFGFDRQFDRTVDEFGTPGEYVEVWMQVEEERG